MKPVSASQTNIQKALRLLHQGKLVAIPTETVYGLGADAKNPEAVKRIFAAKGRPADHPLIVHIPDKAALTDWAIDIPETAWKLAEHFWPGPLTLVLLKHPDVPLEVTGGQNTVALRVPNHPVALAVLKAFGGGIAAPSANRFCRISPTQASHVEEELGDKIDMILDGGACQVGLESTIVDLSGEQPRLLRPGQISKPEIEKILKLSLGLPKDKEKIHAPGRKDVHYSPRTRTRRCTSRVLGVILKFSCFRNNNRMGIIAYSVKVDEDPLIKSIAMPKLAGDYARNFYSALYELDHQNREIIIIEEPPKTEEWSAVNDRLCKASKIFPKAHIEASETDLEIATALMPWLSSHKWMR